MRDRVELLVGGAIRAMWVMTFHSACARMLRADAHRLGYTRQFTIYDSADSRRLIKKCLDDLDIDPKRFTPRAMQAQISDAKNKLRSAEDYRGLVGSFFEQTVADVYEHYERELHRANAMDFDDLLFRAVDLLQLFQEVRDRYANAFRWILVDEYQDTNHAQYRWLAAPGGRAPQPRRGRRRRPVPRRGDPRDHGRRDAQADRGGAGRRRGAVVLRHRRLPPRARHADARGLVRRGGRDHDALRPAAREHARARALRRLPAAREPAAAHDVPAVAPGHGLPPGHDADEPGSDREAARQRRGAARGAGAADAAWVLSTHRSEPEARTEEAVVSLRYQLPTLPFKARLGTSVNGLVHDQALIDRVFASVDTFAHGRRLLADRHLRFDQPHHVPRTYEGRRRNVTVTLCGDRRGRTPMHTVAVGGRDRGAAAALEGIGLTVRPAKAGSVGWRYESCFKDYGAAMHVVARIAEVLPVHVRQVGRLGRPGSAGEVNSLPFVEAQSVRPGMVMFDEHGGYDVVERVERMPLRRQRSTTSTSPGRTTSSPRASSRTTPSTASAAPTSGTSSSSRTPTPRPTWCGWSRTTAPRRPSSAPRTRSSPTTAGARSSRCGRRSARATRSRSASSPTSTPRRASWWPRSSGSWTRGSRAPSSPSSTAPTRSPACSRTCSCGRRSATRSSAARSSTSGPRSRTRSPT